ncbi:hypothetical protein [Pseudonocardia spirodelae]|uniref:Uncharacterized protein n=1 Tax=Pseudonocardia spirodelae TaxID=3133431 RepID=A0ABU8TE65_9PSEU
MVPDPLSAMVSGPRDAVAHGLSYGLSAQVEALCAAALRRPGRAADARWWADRLSPLDRALDDHRRRRHGPPVRRRAAAAALRREGPRVTHITHVPSPPDGAALALAAAAALPDGRPGRRLGALLPVVPALPAAVAVARSLPASGPGTVLVAAGLALLAGAAVAVRLRAARGSRDRECVRRVRAAVLAAAQRALTAPAAGPYGARRAG